LLDIYGKEKKELKLYVSFTLRSGIKNQIL